MGQLYTPRCVIRTTVLVASESKQKPFFLWNQKTDSMISVLFILHWKAITPYTQPFCCLLAWETSTSPKPSTTSPSLSPCVTCLSVPRSSPAPVPAICCEAEHELLTCTFDLGLTVFSPVDDLLGVSKLTSSVGVCRALIFPLVLLSLEHSQPHVQELHLNSPLTLIFLLYRCGWTFPATTSQDESGLN